MTENQRVGIAIVTTIALIILVFSFPPIAFLLIPVGVIIRKWLNRQYFSNTPKIPEFIYFHCESCKVKNRIKTAQSENRVKCGRCGYELDSSYYGKSM